LQSPIALPCLLKLTGVSYFTTETIFHNQTRVSPSKQLLCSIHQTNSQSQNQINPCLFLPNLHHALLSAHHGTNLQIHKSPKSSKPTGLCPLPSSQNHHLSTTFTSPQTQPIQNQNHHHTNRSTMPITNPPLQFTEPNPSPTP
jgi:hypothetical protein